MIQGKPDSEPCYTHQKYFFTDNVPPSASIAASHRLHAPPPPPRPTTSMIPSPAATSAANPQSQHRNPPAQAVSAAPPPPALSATMAPSTHPPPRSAPTTLTAIKERLVGEVAQRSVMVMPLEMRSSWLGRGRMRGEGARLMIMWRSISGSS